MIQINSRHAKVEMITMITSRRTIMIRCDYCGRMMMMMIIIQRMKIMMIIETLWNPSFRYCWENQGNPDDPPPFLEQSSDSRECPSLLLPPTDVSHYGNFGRIVRITTTPYIAISNGVGTTDSISSRTTIYQHCFRKCFWMVGPTMRNR